LVKSAIKHYTTA